jgi:hypothetical protein
VLLAAILVRPGSQNGSNPFPSDSALAAIADDLFKGVPEAARDEFRDAYRELLADRMQGKNALQIANETAELTRKGFARLGDDDLVRRLDLQTLALGRASTEDCAAFMRMGLGGIGNIDLAVAGRIVLELDGDELVEWYRLSIKALRAQLAESPAARIASQADFEAAFGDIAARWNQSEVDLVTSVTANPASASDADVCRLADLIYGHLDVLSDADYATLALYDISPPQ